MVVLISKYKIEKVCPTAEQAFYHADILKLADDIYVDDAALPVFEKFSTTELKTILNNHNVTYRDTNDIETLCGHVLLLIKELAVDETDCVTLYGQLKREPLPPKIVKLSDAEREKQMGPAFAGRTYEKPAGGSTAVKRPKAGTTTASVWDKCDELLASGLKISDNSLRDACLAWGEEAGINKSTVRTQYGHWKRDNL